MMKQNVDKEGSFKDLKLKNNNIKKMNIDTIE